MATRDAAQMDPRDREQHKRHEVDQSQFSRVPSADVAAASGPGAEPGAGAKTSSTVPTRRKKKHTYGAYPCDYPDCSKVFQRSDHLSRHKLTHDVSARHYVCAWPGCDKRFNRSDTMKLHYNRHQKGAVRQTELKPHVKDSVRGKSGTPVGGPVGGPVGSAAPTAATGTPPYPPQQAHAAPGHHGSMLSTISTMLNTNFQSNFMGNSDASGASGASGAPGSSAGTPVGQTVHREQTPVIPSGMPSEMAPSAIPSEMHRDMHRDMHRELTPTAPSAPAFDDTDFNMKHDLFFQPSDMLSLLFPEEFRAPDESVMVAPFPSADTTAPVPTHYGSTAKVEQNSYNLFDPSQGMILDKLATFPISPGTFNSTAGAEIHIDADVMARLAEAVPALAANVDFHPAALQRALQIYWSLHSTRIAVIHRPSFDTRTAHPVLLLAMVMTGAALSRTTDQDEAVFVDAQALAQAIAGPLRWVIFQLPELTAAKPWVIQSLIILETFEKHMSNRDLYQRSTVHHATKVQILRRSTTLGGDPYRKDNFEAETLWGMSSKSSHLWGRWIEAESMKRCAYATFLLDSYNAVLTSQTVALYAHQLKLSLPCNEDLWLAPGFDQDFLKNYDWKTKSFVSVFIDTINERSPAHQVRHAPKLLAAIISLIFLFQNTSAMMYQSGSANDNWRNMLVYLLESWLVNVKQGNCCGISIDRPPDRLAGEYNVSCSYWADSDPRCKLAIYHLAHVVIWFSNWDWMTYSGSPLLMNVRAEYSDYEAVSMRVQKWSRSKEGGVGVANAYLAVIECFLPPAGRGPDAPFERYSPNKDVFFERPYCLGQLAVIIWCFNFSLKGPESGFLDNEMNKTYYLNDQAYINSHVREDGYHYLARIRDLFRTQDVFFDGLLDKEAAAGTLTAARKTSIYHRRLQAYAAAVVNAPDSHHTAGFMLMMSDVFASSILEMCVELSRLMKHCQSRSLGNREIKCMSMYNSI